MSLCLDPGTLGFDLPYEEYLRISAAAGCDWAEVPVSALRAAGPHRLRAMLATHGLRPGPFSCPWDGNPNGAVPEDEWRSRVRAMPVIFAQIRAAGGDLVSAFFRGERPGMVPLGADGVAGRCAVLTGLAAAEGLRVCVELNDVAVLRAARDVPADLLVDTFHLWRAGLGVGWVAALPPGKIRWVHVSGVPVGLEPPADLPRIRPFDGVQDLPPLLDAVRANGYRGPLSIEVLPAPATGREAYAVELVRSTRSGSERTGFSGSTPAASP